MRPRRARQPSFPRQSHPLYGCLCVATLLTFAQAITTFAAEPATENQAQWQLWKINADGTGLARLADTPGYSCGSPKFSPDGTLIAYDTRPPGSDYTTSEIAVIRADGSDQRRLGPGGMPSWSPDGMHLVFHTYDNPQKIAVMKADGTGREIIAYHWGSPRWLAKSDRIATISADRSLSLIDLATGTERKILSGPHSIRPGFAVTSDGRRFCFGEDTGGLWIGFLDETTMQLEARNVWALGYCYHAAWSPDAKRIVFGWQLEPPYGSVVPVGTGFHKPSPHQLYIFNVGSKEMPAPLAGQDEQRSNTNPDWSPDGKSIVFASQLPN
jgi:Tol biopolymer transport system component